MDALKNLSEIKRELKQVHSSATATDRFMAKCFPLMIELHIEQTQLLKQLVKKSSKKRKSSEWNKFMSYHMKQGKHLKEVAELWKSKQEMLST